MATASLPRRFKVSGFLRKQECSLSGGSDEYRGGSTNPQGNQHPAFHVKECFTEYGLQTDAGGRYAALYRPVHLVGMELSVSVLKAGLAEEATGCPGAFVGDVVATAKRGLSAGEVLDGEGGYTVYGRLQPSATAARAGGLPIGLAHEATLLNDIPAGSPIGWSDVRHDPADPAVLIRREMEATFKPVD